MAKKKNRYVQIIELIFFKHYTEDKNDFPFHRSEIVDAAKELGIELPKNLGDVLYSFRYRTALPESILQKAPEDYEWIIRPSGRSKYRFVLTKESKITPSTQMAESKILDGTPGIIDKYTQGDEQALLAKLRYNRLIDIFTGLTCYSLQNHLRTTVPEIGQVEIDEIYVGIDKRGAQYIVPVQAKSGKDKIGIVQIEQDLAVCEYKFPGLIPRAIAAQFLENQVIALFEFEESDDGIVVSAEKHYKLVGPGELSQKELDKYKKRPF